MDVGALFASTMNLELSDNVTCNPEGLNMNANAGGKFAPENPNLIRKLIGRVHSADHLAFSRTHGGIYRKIVNFERDLFAADEYDSYTAMDFIAQYKIGKPTHRAIKLNAISFSYRYFERRPFKDRRGSYWVTYDAFEPGDNEKKNSQYPDFIKEGRLPEFGPFNTRFNEFDGVAAEAWIISTMAFLLT